MVKTRLKLTAILIGLLVIAGGYFAYTNQESNDKTVIEFGADSLRNGAIQFVVTYGYNRDKSTEVTRTVTSPFQTTVLTERRVSYLTLLVKAPTGYPGLTCYARANGKSSTHSPRTTQFSNSIDCSGTVFGA
jgi:hypothetical protein